MDDCMVIEVDNEKVNERKIDGGYVRTETVARVHFTYIVRYSE